MIHNFLSSLMPSVAKHNEVTIEEDDADDARSSAASSIVVAFREEEMSPSRRRRRDIKKREYSNTFDSSDDHSFVAPSTPQRKITPTDSDSPPRRKKTRTVTTTLPESIGSDYRGGWLEKSQLAAIATHFQGTASQFRIVYSEFEVKDCNTKRTIPPRTLVVQTRFVSANGNGGGRTCAFMTWRLPGTVSYHSIYNDTRPRAYSPSAAANANPTICLDEALHPMAKMVIATFLDEAEPGTAPLQFYRDTECSEILVFLTHAPITDSKQQDVYKFTTSNSSRSMLEDEADGERSLHSDADSDDDDDEDSTTISAVQSSHKQKVSTSRPTTRSSDGNKEKEESSDNDEESSDSDEEGSLPNQRGPQTYTKQVTLAKKDESDDDSENFFHDVAGAELKEVEDASQSRLEDSPEDDDFFNAFDDEADPIGIDQGAEVTKDEKDGKESDDELSIAAPATASTQNIKSIKRRRPFSSSIRPITRSAKRSRKIYGGSKQKKMPTSTSFHHDHLRELFMERRVENVPRKGRLVELLPAEALPGDWEAKIVNRDGVATRVPGLLRNNVRDMNGIRISFRHESFHQLGILSETRSMRVSKSDNRQVHVSAIEPSVTRLQNLQQQGVLSNGDELPVIGSISIASCVGCTSLADANSSTAGELASGILEGVHTAFLTESLDVLQSIGFLENLLPIASQHANSNDVTNIGVSFLCNFNVKERYTVLVAQDEEGRTVAVDVVLVPSSRLSLSSTSTDSTTRRPQLTMANIKRLEAEEANALSSKDLSSVITGARIARSCDLHDRNSSFPESPAAFYEAESDTQEITGNIERVAILAVTTPALPAIKRNLQGAVQSLISFVRSPIATSMNENRMNQKSSIQCTTTEGKSFLAKLSSIVLPIAAVTPASLKTKLVSVKDSLPNHSPTMATQVTLPFVTPFTERAENTVDRLDNLLQQDDLETLRQSVLDFNESTHISPFVCTRSSRLKDDQVGRRMAKNNRCINISLHARPLASRNRSIWGIMGFLMFFYILVAFQIKVPPYFSQTLRSNRRTTLILQNPSFQELLIHTEKGSPVIYEGFSVVGSEWVSMLAIGCIAATFGVM